MHGLHSIECIEGGILGQSQGARGIEACGHQDLNGTPDDVRSPLMSHLLISNQAKRIVHASRVRTQPLEATQRWPHQTDRLSANQKVRTGRPDGWVLRRLVMHVARWRRSSFNLCHGGREMVRKPPHTARNGRRP